MDTSDVLADAFGRIRGLVHQTTAGLGSEALTFRPEADANPIGWLVWHLTRIQDDHVSELAGREQAWGAEQWHARFAMPADPHNTGYGHTSLQVADVRPEGPQVLVDYHETVFARTSEYVSTLDAHELDRIVDRSYDPPVSVGVRLVSVIGDSLQHAGQAAYVRGILERRSRIS